MNKLLSALVLSAVVFVSNAEAMFFTNRTLENRITDETCNNLIKQEKIEFSTTTKAMVTSIAVTAGIAATWFYGGPALYCLGFYATQYMVPTTGFAYFAYGFPLYNNAGIALATSPIAQSALAAAVATAAVYAANITISLSENTLNAMDYVKNNFGNTNYYSTI